jgi:actin-related protein
MRERILAQRRAEEERRRADEAERQVLRLSLERFAIPELLFAPQDGNLPAEWAALPTAIIQCIESCPQPYRAGLYRSIQLTGGLSMLPGLRSRLLREVRRLVHPDYNADYKVDDDEEENESRDQHAATSAQPLLHIRTLPDPLVASWRGGCRLVNNNENYQHLHDATISDPSGTTTGRVRWCVSSLSAGPPSASSTVSTAATGTTSASLRKQLISEGGYYF